MQSRSLSVVIPVYRVEQYLEQCVKSVLSQIDSSTEIILVDDGSPDRCPEMCDALARQWPCISTIHQTNAGLSGARNTGIEAATGDFILFLDSDDVILETGLEGVYQQILAHPQCDVFMFSYREMDATGTPLGVKGYIQGLDPGIYDATPQLLAQIITGCVELWPAWKSVVRRDFVNSHGLRFANGLIHEDVDWTSKLLLSCRRIGYADRPFYGYRKVRDGAITESIRFRNFDHTFRIVAGVMREIDKNIDRADELAPHLRQRLSEACFAMLRAYHNSSDEEKELICQRLASDRLLLQYSTALKHRCFCLFLDVFGAPFSMRVYDWLTGVGCIWRGALG